jgi:predicted membrane-bound spermidine synthase
MAVYGGVLPFLLAQPIPAPTFAFPLLAFVAGCLGGMTFPLAVTVWNAECGMRSAGFLYGADLLGGCLGALAGAAFLVPVLGIPQTCAAVALVGLAALAALP